MDKLSLFCFCNLGDFTCATSYVLSIGSNPSMVDKKWRFVDSTLRENTGSSVDLAVVAPLSTALITGAKAL